MTSIKLPPEAAHSENNMLMEGRPCLLHSTTPSKQTLKERKLGGWEDKTF